MSQSPVYQLHITLNGSKPPIWRKLTVPSDITLGKLHEVIQIAMGWTNSHLHRFDQRVKISKDEQVRLWQIPGHLRSGPVCTAGASSLPR